MVDPSIFSLDEPQTSSSAQLTNSANNYVSLDPSQNQFANQAVGFDQSAFSQPAIPDYSNQPAPDTTFGDIMGAQDRVSYLQGIDRNPAQETELQNLLEQEPTFQEPDIDISPALKAYDEAEAAVRQSTETGISGLDLGAQQAKEEEQASLQLGQQQITKSRTKSTQERDAALAEQQNMASEQLTGLAARFGGSTGLGAFAGELLGRRVLTNIANLRSSYANLQGDLNFEERRLNEGFNLRIRQISDNLEQAKAEARANLQQELARISGMRAGAQMAKSEARLQALRDYQANVQGVQARNASFLQGLYQARDNAMLKISTARQMASDRMLRSSESLMDRMFNNINTFRNVASQGLLDRIAGSQGLPAGSFVQTARGETGSGALDSQSLVDEFKADLQPVGAGQITTQS